MIGRWNISKPLLQRCSRLWTLASNLSPCRWSVAIACLVFLLPSSQSSSFWFLHLRGLSIPTSVAVAICSRILSVRPCHRSRTDGINFKIMHPIMLNRKIKNKQITIEHNFIKYSYCCTFRPYGVIIRLTLRTYERSVHIALWK